ncbi:MAG: head GIN domain-containing protein [Melioribacteraceae bacterium]
MKNYIPILLVIVSLLFTSCQSKPTIRGSGTSSSEDRVSGFINQIVVNGDFEIDITCGKTNSIKVEAEDNILPLVETIFEGERLTISTKEEITALKIIKIIVTLHSLEEIDSDGKSKITIHSIDSDELEVIVNEEGVIELDGKVDELNINIDDEAKVLAKSLLSKVTNVNIYGDGMAEVHARKYFDAQVKGKGVVNYWGDPEEIRISASGGGSVNKK